MGGPEIRRLITGARLLFSNEYEAALITQKTGWSAEEVLARVGTQVTTLGAKGARIERRGEPAIEISVPRERSKTDPTGVGDAFRSGYLAGLAWGVGERRAAEVGAMLATLVVETVGTQEYDLQQGAFLTRFAQCYGAAAAGEIGHHIPVRVG
jgi:adenosine kinase